MYTFQKKGLRIIEHNPFSFLSDILQEHRELEEELLPVIKRGKGPYVYDYDENRFIDFFLAHGSLTLGHGPPDISRVMKSWLGRGYAPGYQAASHSLLAKKLFTLLVNSTIHKGKGYRWFFYDSPYEAFHSLFSLLELCGHTNWYTYPVNSPGFTRHMPILSTWIQPFSGSVKDLASGSCIIFNPVREGKNIDMIKELRERGALIVSDESGIDGHLHLRGSRELCDCVQVRFFGSWVASGYSFGCILAGNSFLSRIKSGMSREIFERLLPYAGFPPLYKIKMAIASAIHMEKCEGIEGLIKKNRLFFSLLGDRYFLLRDGLVYMNMTKNRSLQYRELHKILLREGIYFPLSPREPVFTSFAHTENLLKRSAPKINSLFNTFYR